MEAIALFLELFQMAGDTLSDFRDYGRETANKNTPQNFMSTNQQRLELLSEEVKQTVQVFDNLGTDEKLAFLYFVYEKMGDSVTPAAPAAAEPNLAPKLLGSEFYDLSEDDQLQVMRDIVDNRDTELSRAYGALTENNQLLVWYAWAQGMGDTVVDLPADYKASEETNRLVPQLEKLDFESQISFLRQVAGEMGYSEVGQTPTQTQKTPSL